MISNIDDLMEEARKIESKENRAKYIMNYYLENVKYNYGFLFVAHMGGDDPDNKVRCDGIQETMKNCIKGEKSPEYSSGFVFTDESRIVNHILELRDNNNGDYNEFISKIEEYIKSELASYFKQDSELVNEPLKKVMDYIKQWMEVEPIERDGILYSFDITMAIHDLLYHIDERFPDEFENGLITNGVCKSYTKHLVPLLRDAGIEAHDVEGISELDHEWIIIKDDEGQYKSMDLTRAVFIRDGHAGIPEEQTSQEWLYHDIDKGFEMQETRCIREIDGIELPIPINGENYDKDEFAKLMKQISKTIDKVDPVQTPEELANDKAVREAYKTFEQQLVKDNERGEEVGNK